jgi:2-desacetyl-2-hydroxyethyl bacteriochlorophyllide A dehydrogenase
MEVVDVDVPETGPDDVLIEVAYAGICGSELSGYLGTSSLRTPPQVMGHEFSGTVARVGERVEQVGVGDPVTVNPLVSCGRCERCTSGRAHLCERRQLIGAHRPGAFADFVVVPEGNVHRLPADADLEAAAWTEPIACAIHACRLAEVARGQDILILGAGPIGLLILTVASGLGVGHVSVVDRNPDRLQAADALGAAPVVASDPEVARDHLLNASYDVVFDAVGVDSTRSRSVELARPGGTVLFCGLHSENSPLPVNLAVRNELSLRGSFAYAPVDFERALERGGEVVLRAWSERVRLEDGGAAFTKLIEGPGPTVKILIDVAA